MDENALVIVQDFLHKQMEDSETKKMAVKVNRKRKLLAIKKRPSNIIKMVSHYN